MNSVLILLAYACAASMQSILRQFEWYRTLYRQFPFYVPESLKVGAGVVLCAVIAMWLYGQTDRFALRRSGWRAVLFGLAASMPMLIGFALTRSIRVEDAVAVLFLAGFFPLAEEIVSRGFAFRLLYEREGWSWWMAAGIVAAVTGAAHVSKSQTAFEVFGLFALTGIGGGVFSWLLARWGSLWFPFTLHAFMNFWWEVFGVSRTALGGWFAFLLQFACIVAAVAITLHYTATLAEATQKWQKRRTGRETTGMQFAMSS